MNKFMRKLWAKKESKKGFTLVELIVVLVILAILAAIMIPSLVGWIDKAREKETVLTARNAELAAQSIVLEYYAQTKTGASKDGAITYASDNNYKLVKDIAKYDDSDSIKIADLNTDYTIKEFYYYDASAKLLATYENNAWVIEKSETGIPTTP